VQDSFLFNFEKELFVHVSILENEKNKVTQAVLDKSRLAIRDRLTMLAPIFVKNKYMLGEEFSCLMSLSPHYCGA
jgi:RNA polymerase-associated protein